MPATSDSRPILTCIDCVVSRDDAGRLGAVDASEDFASSLFRFLAAVGEGMYAIRGLGETGTRRRGRCSRGDVATGCSGCALGLPSSPW